MVDRVVAWLIGALLVALTLYSVFVGVMNVQGIQQQAELFDVSVTPLGWLFVIAHITIPLITLAIAFLLSRRSSRWVRVLVIATSLAVNAAAQLVLTDLESRVLTWQVFFA